MKECEKLTLALSALKSIEKLCDQYMDSNTKIGINQLEYMKMIAEKTIYAIKMHKEKE